MLKVKPNDELETGVWQGRVKLHLTCVFTKLTIMILNFPEPKYFIHAKKGDSIHYSTGMFRVQEDKGWLYIYPTINEKRTKVDARGLFCEPGSEADWVFNNWWQFYEYEEFESFMRWEMAVAE